MIQAHTGAQAQSDIQESEVARNNRLERSKARRTTLQKGGALKVSQARNMICNTEREVARKASAAAARAERQAARSDRERLKQQRLEL